MHDQEAVSRVLAGMTLSAGPRPHLARVLGLLERVRASGSGWAASCPGPMHRNGDRDPSLSVGLGVNGAVILDCHAGCATGDVLAALGLQFSDLWEQDRNGGRVARYALVDATGRVLARHVRVDKPNGDKRLHWESHAGRSLNGTPVESLPLYRLGDLLAAPPAQPVIVTEGEKAADALAGLGLLAVGTVTGAASAPCDTSLAPLRGRDVWLWPDADEQGRAHMGMIAANLQRSLGIAPRWVVWPDAPDKGDAADYAERGGTAEGVAAMVADWPPEERRNGHAEQGIKVWNAGELMSATFRPPRWAVPELIPEGLIILAGRPKLGKSWLALGLVVDVTAGRAALRSIKTTPGEALYLALEDGPRRIQERLHLVLGETPVPAGLHVATDWPRTDEGGLDLLEEWLVSHPEARLVVIDTFKRVRAKEKGSQRLYDLDYDALEPLAKLAITHRVAIIVVFHTRKGESSDPLEMVSGTLGLSGAADAVMVLRRERGQADAALFVTGRDVEERDLALRWERDDTFGWALLGNAEDFRLSRERKQLLEAIETMPGMTPAEIADSIGKPRGSARRLLFSMARDGEVRTRDGRYYPNVL